MQHLRGRIVKSDVPRTYVRTYVRTYASSTVSRHFGAETKNEQCAILTLRTSIFTCNIVGKFRKYEFSYSKCPQCYVNYMYVCMSYPLLINKNTSLTRGYKCTETTCVMHSHNGKPSTNLSVLGKAVDGIND